MERKKTDKEKAHKGIWRSGCPGGVPGTNSGRPRDTWDIWAWFMCKSILKGQNVPGTDGPYHGTDGTCPRDRRGRTPGGVPPKFFMFIGFFHSPLLGEMHATKLKTATETSKADQCLPHQSQRDDACRLSAVDQILTPPTTQNSLVRISVCNEVSNGNSYQDEPDREKKLLLLQFFQDFHSHSNGKQVSLIRIILKDNVLFVRETGRGNVAERPVKEI